MAQCPFCKSSIDDELARFGGHCPKCVIEIPGDETPTDPGIGKRAEEQVETERQRRWGVFAAVGGLVLVVVVAAGSMLWWRIDQQRQAELAAQQDAAIDFEFTIASAAGHELPTLQPRQDENPGSGASSSRGHGGSVTTVPSSSSSGSTGSKRYDFIGSSEESQPELAKLQERTIDVAPGADLGSMGPSISISRGGLAGLALSDPEEIRQSVGTALKVYSKQMNTCYERRLKATPDLAGTWDVSFTIGTSGRTAAIAVVPHTTRDASLESCMSNAIATWTFTPMVSPQNFAKAYTFGVE